ncbi:MAG: PBECR4 domain-containing protein [Lachnospiraceae bacterium]|nr:PBECR4 domain-containing protein [Lachnospiraceae bacterium]
MKDTKLLDKFNEAKQILCGYDYYIHIPKKILHLTNGELKIPHLMGLQYIAKEGMFEGDQGVYMIKSGRLRYDSIEKLIQKYYKRTEKQKSVAAMVYGKINNLPRINEMLRSESVLYLYDITANPELRLKTDYLLVNQQQDVVLQLGLIKAAKTKEQICHCNSFMVDYKKDADYDLHYRNLTHCYEISKIVCEEKDTKRAEVIYQSRKAEQRERAGIEKMFEAAGIVADEKLIKTVLRLNKKFGIYHTPDMLNDREALLKQCKDKREMNIVMDFFALWEENGIHAGTVGGR